MIPKPYTNELLDRVVLTVLVAAREPMPLARIERRTEVVLGIDRIWTFDVRGSLQRLEDDGKAATTPALLWVAKE